MTGKTKKMVKLTVDDLENAGDMSVEEFKDLYKEDTVEDITLRNKALAEIAAKKKLLSASRGLGHAVNELLLEFNHLEKRWPMILATLDSKGTMRKLATSDWPLIGKWAKKRIDSKIDKTILEVLPDLLMSQLNITQKADKRVYVQKTTLLQAQIEAGEYYNQLGTDMIQLRKEAKKSAEQFEKVRKEIQAIDKRFEAGDIPETEYNKLVKDRTNLIMKDSNLELALQTVTENLRATEDGYNMTELQISQITTTLKSINTISTMLKAFLRIVKPIMNRSIVILNAQKAGIDAAELLHALSETMNQTLKICSYGMTVMTQQAIMLSDKDFLEKQTIQEVKEIQEDNDRLWDHFTKTQYEKVMAKVQPLMSYTERAGSAEKQDV